MALIINISRESLLESLAALQSVTSKKGSMPILTNVLLSTENNAICLTGTDLEVGIKNICPAEIISEGSITLPSRKLFEIVRETFAESVHLEETGNNWVRIKAGSSDYNLAGMGSEEFPAFPSYEEANLQKVEALILRDLVDRTFFSIAHESESPYSLTSALFEKDQNEDGKYILRMVASDSHRLALMERESNDDLGSLDVPGKTLIPRKGVQEIRKFCENRESVFVSFDNKQAILKSEDSILVIRLMSGEFPEYRGIATNIDRDLSFEIDRVTLLNSMKRMNIFTEDRFNVVKIDLEKNNITITSQNADIGNAKDEIPLDYNGNELQIFFNGKYFVEALQVLESKKVSLHIASGKSPCIITSEEEPGFLGVIMPMKL